MTLVASTVETMRGVLPLAKVREYRESLDPVLINLFVKPTGSFVGGVSKSIGEYPALQFRNRLNVIVKGGKPSFDWVLPEGIQGLLTYTNWLDAKGKKNSRNIVAALKKVGYDTDSKEFQGWMAEWIAGFLVPDGKYEIRWDIEAFDDLGQYGVDEDSCYTYGHEYTDAPVVLATGFAGKAVSFIILLRDDNRGVIARCWGFIPEGSLGMYLSNGYYSDGMVHGMHTFVKAIEAATGQAYQSVAQVPTGTPIYHNRDGVWVTPTGSDVVPDHTEYCNSVCISCGKKSTDGRLTCTLCRGFKCNGCEENYQGVTQVRCDRCEEYFCQSCYDGWHCDHDDRDYDDQDDD